MLIEVLHRGVNFHYFESVMLHSANVVAHHVNTYYVCYTTSICCPNTVDFEQTSQPNGV